MKKKLTIAIAVVLHLIYSFYLKNIQLENKLRPPKDNFIRLIEIEKKNTSVALPPASIYFAIIWRGIMS